MIALAAFVSCLPLTGVAVREPVAVELALRPEKEKVYRFEWTSDATNKTSFMGMTSETKLHTVQEVTLKALDSPADGPVRMQLTYERARGEFHTPMGVIQYDSNGPAPEIPPMLEALGAVVQSQTAPVGRSVTVEIDRHGKVLSVTGYAAIFEGNAGVESLEANGTSFTDETAAQDLQQIFSRLPEGAIAQDSTWTYPIAEALLGHNVVFDARARMTKLGDADAAFEFTAESQDHASANPASAETAPAEGALAGASVETITVRGTSTVSRADGMPLENVVEQKVDALVPNPMGGDPLPTTIELRVVAKRIDAPRAE